MASLLLRWWPYYRSSYLELLTSVARLCSRPAPQAVRPTGRIWLKSAQILIERHQDAGICTNYIWHWTRVGYLNWDNQLVASDTQFSLQVLEGSQIRNAVGHLIGAYQVDINDAITIRGQLGWAKQKQMTPLNLLILRVVMLTFGRFFPNLIRKLQKMLITGRRMPFRFQRHLRLQGRWCITDELLPVLEARAAGCDQTSIYVVMPHFQRGQLQPWLDLTQSVRLLAPGRSLTLKRYFLVILLTP